MARLLVTGGSGFLGSHLVEALVDHGHTVTVFDRVRSPRVPETRAVRWMTGDLGDAAALATAVQDQDMVYHLAGFADLNAAKTRPLDTVQTNIVVFALAAGGPDAAAVVAAAREHGVLVNALGARRVRVLTHRDVTRAQCVEAAGILAAAAAG